MSATTVTIDLSYFQTLLRRAQFHTSSLDFTMPADLSTVTVLKVDHDNLVLRSQAYANLRNNLIRGGTSNETLDILTKNFDTAVEFEETATDTSDEGFLSQMPLHSLRLRPSSQNAHGTFENRPHNVAVGPADQASWVVAGNRNANASHNRPHHVAVGPADQTSWVVAGNRNGNASHNRPHHVAVGPADQTSWVVAANRNGNASQNQGHGNQGYGNQDYVNNLNDFSTINRTENAPRISNKKRFQPRDTRSVKICKLPADVTYSEIIAIVRGGLLLDIVLRRGDRAATISYMDECAAAAFLCYIEGNTVTIRGQRLTAKWANRHSLVSSHVAYRVNGGATRNLIVLGGSDRHTEANVRDDLRHIDNLVVIKVVISGSDIQISTNSISIAIVARTCMLSRSKYKMNKIIFGSDECCGPLPPRLILVPIDTQPLLGVGNHSVNRGTPISKNRFEVLHLDSNDDGDNDEESDSRTA